MKHSLLALILLCGAAVAQDDRAARITHMADECRAIMARGWCSVQRGARLPESARKQRWFLGNGLGIVTAGDYIDLQAAGTDMCELIAPACTEDWDGARCRLVRSLWRQE